MPHISWCQSLSENFISEFIDKLHWRGILECQSISNSFIYEMQNKIQV